MTINFKKLVELFVQTKELPEILLGKNYDIFCHGCKWFLLKSRPSFSFDKETFRNGHAKTLFQEKLQLPDLPSVTPDFEIR